MPDPAIVVDTGPSPWTILLVALIGGLATFIPKAFAAITAWANRKKIAADLAALEDQQKLERLKREEEARVAAAERAKITAHLAEVTNTLRAVTPALEAAMVTRVANQASTEAQLAGIAAAVGATPSETPPPEK